MVDTVKIGYQLHLKAIGVFLKLALGIDENRRMIFANAILKRQPKNPFFEYLAFGPSSNLQTKLLTLCPSPGDSLEFQRRQWAWERNTDSEAWLESMGWDCIFLANLIRHGFSR